MKDYDENFTVDFTKFMQKIQEVEAQKAQLVLPKPEMDAETPQRLYAKRYQERSANCIYVRRR